MRGRQNEGPKIGAVQPQRQFTPDHPAGLPAAASGDDFHAAHMVGRGIVQEPAERLEGGLRGFAVQIERSGSDHAAAREPVPGGAVEAGRVGARGQGGVHRALGCTREGRRGWWCGGSRRGFGHLGLVRAGRCRRCGAAAQGADVARECLPDGAIVFGQGAWTARHGGGM
jgi:hypothetical protein